ncbi:hypothetical protein NDU88_001452 [Pleurodeles waltl]|uniref:Uncharacterized protein n=1 Tax=Pleurodeles waltl TaxID=8319 RepID=A0AAV7KQD0_PLEWA|nr:hypothetical protein NDU88_001452 [Pleurodeles waltl]
MHGAMQGQKWGLPMVVRTGSRRMAQGVAAGSGQRWRVSLLVCDPVVPKLMAPTGSSAVRQQRSQRRADRGPDPEEDPADAESVNQAKSLRGEATGKEQHQIGGHAVALSRQGHAENTVGPA